jgi:predicted Ser/Thr protein kinase
VSYPSIEQYQEVLQSPRAAFVDSLLARGTIRTSGMLGTPQVVSGGFALTYAVEVDGTKYAVRCFHRDAKHLERRYAAVSRKLESLRSNYFVEFQFQSKGIKANGDTFPIVKMAWASGKTLGEFVEANQADPNKLSALIDALKTLATDLESLGIAHGDIQEGNLMVSDNGRRLQLIDYDGMYVPELASMGSAEIGHRDFQHPGRDSTKYDANLDRFSFISLNLALRALCDRPSLWNSSQSGAGVIVFKANDFADPASSATLDEISRIPSLERDAKNFASVCMGSYSQVPTLVDFLSSRNIPAQTVVFGGGRNVGQRSVGYISQDIVVDGSNYPAFARHIGERIELIGQITSLRFAKTKYGKPCVFINLGTYPGCVSLTLWSNALSTKGEQPSEKWRGQWISIRSLVEPPNQKQMHPAAFVQVEKLTQILQLSERDAKYRLAGRGPAADHRNTNSERLAKMQGDAGLINHTISNRIPKHHSTSVQPIAKRSANQQVLDQMRQQTAPTASPNSSGTPLRVNSSSPYTPSPSPSPSPSTTPQQKAVAPQTKSMRIPGWVWVVAIIGGYFILRLLKH